MSSAERRAIIAKLQATQPTIHQSYLYDERGCALYEAIVSLDEYYLPRAEANVLHQHGSDIASPCLAGSESAMLAQQVIVELGCGSGKRTIALMEDMTGHAVRSVLVPTDVAPRMLELNAETFAASRLAERDDVVYAPLAGTHEMAIERAAGRGGGSKTFMFMGSSLGNLNDEEIQALFRRVSVSMGVDGRLLLGVDAAHRCNRHM